ncbi:unnamed protein product, partial [Scytosiphon promiscuus]
IGYRVPRRLSERTEGEADRAREGESPTQSLGKRNKTSSWGKGSWLRSLEQQDGSCLRPSSQTAVRKHHQHQHQHQQRPREDKPPAPSKPNSHWTASDVAVAPATATPTTTTTTPTDGPGHRQSPRAKTTAGCFPSPVAAAGALPATPKRWWKGATAGRDLAVSFATGAAATAGRGPPGGLLLLRRRRRRRRRQQRSTRTESPAGNRYFPGVCLRRSSRWPLPYRRGEGASARSPAASAAGGSGDSPG